MWSGVAQRHGVLRQIFQYIPTNILLSSSSLVNKIWNHEARALIRERRKCIVKDNPDMPVWKFLEDLDQLCGQMKIAGRFCPLNCLQITVPDICGSHCNPEEVFYANINSEFKLKYMKISSDEFPCQCHMAILPLMREKAKEIKTLKIESALFYEFKSGRDWNPQFPQLEELDIEEIEFGNYDAGECEREHKELLSWLLRDTPNLKRITAGNLERLAIVPEAILERVNFTGRLDIRVETNIDISMLQAVSNKGSGLSEIWIGIDEPYYDGPSIDPVDPIARRQYDSAVEHLLQSCHQNLKVIRAIGYPLAQFHTPLSKLSSLEIMIDTEEDEDFWKLITLIDFKRKMPGLKEVYVYIGRDIGGHGELEPYNGDVQYCSDTVQELE